MKFAKGEIVAWVCDKCGRCHLAIRDDDLEPVLEITLDNETRDEIIRQMLGKDSILQ